MALQGGVYATFGVDGTGALVAQSLLRGGQFTNRVKPGDALLAVDDRPIDGLSVEEVRAMLRGPEGGQARLDFLRRASPEQGRDDSVITVYVYRTGTEAQEIQVATLAEILDLATNHSTDFGPSSVWETAKVMSWRMPASIDDRLHQQVCDSMMAVSKALYDERHKGESELSKEATLLRSRVASLEAQAAQTEDEIRFQKVQTHSHYTDKVESQETAERMRERIRLLEDEAARYVASHAREIEQHGNVIAELQTKIAAARRYTETLEKELLVDPSEGIFLKCRIPKPWLSNREACLGFQQDLLKDVALSLGVNPDRMTFVGMEDVTEAMKKQRTSSVARSGSSMGGGMERMMLDGDIVVECDIMILGLGKQNTETVHGRYYEHSYAQSMPARDMAYEIIKQADEAGSFLHNCKLGARVMMADFKDLFEIVQGLQHTVRYLQTNRGGVVTVASKDLFSQLVQNSPLQEPLDQYSNEQTDTRILALVSKNKEMSAELAIAKSKGEDLSGRFDQMHGELNRAHDQIQRFQMMHDRPGGVQAGKPGGSKTSVKSGEVVELEKTIVRLENKLRATEDRLAGGDDRDDEPGSERGSMAPLGDFFATMGVGGGGGWTNPSKVMHMKPEQLGDQAGHLVV